MKFLIASDLHGDLAAARLLLERFEHERADRLILLGDLLYHGPRNDLPQHYEPKGVIALLNAMHTRILAVRGNCDTEVDHKRCSTFQFFRIMRFFRFQTGRLPISRTGTNIPMSTCSPLHPMT